MRADRIGAARRARPHVVDPVHAAGTSRTDETPQRAAASRIADTVRIGD